jgi:hypothetical protein
MSRGVASAPLIVAHTLSYPPARRIGAELATHALLAHMVDRGWRAVVIPGSHPNIRPYLLDGVLVSPSPLAAGVRADVVLAHIPLHQAAQRTAGRSSAPLVMTAHGGPPGWIAQQARGADPDMLIVNSETMHLSAQRTGLPLLTVRPPVWPEEHALDSAPDGACVTLINGNSDKGGLIVAELARRMPDIPFLVVEGGYGQTVPALETMPNVTVVPHGSVSMRWVWERTRVLLMPSIDESWGMVAVEAMHSGIPVIGSTAPGLAECLGEEMPKIDRSYLSVWEQVLRGAYDEDWERLHIASLRRGYELHPAADLSAASAALAALIGREEVMGDVDTFANTRTGQTATAERGSRIHARLSGMPLVWRLVEPADEPDEPAGEPIESTGEGEDRPADAVSEPPACPTRSASKAAWVEYAVSRGSDRAAASGASKSVLIALYGD